MRSVICSICALLIPTASFAYESESQEVVFEDTVELFSFLTFDTGELPNPGDVVTVRFYVTPTGGVTTRMEAESQVTWPDALTHSITPTGNGIFGIDTGVDIGFEFGYNVFGLASGTYPLFNEGFTIVESTTFNTLLLNGSPEAPLDVSFQNTSLIPTFAFDLDVIPAILSMTIGVEMFPEISATLQGVQIDTTTDAGTFSMLDEGVPSLVALPANGPTPPDYAFDSTYIGDINSRMSFVIRPFVDLDSIAGGFNLFAFDIPVDFINNSEIRNFDPIAYVHPLPSLDPISITNDLGDVLLGNLKNVQVPFANLGRLGLEGWASIEGSDKFTVFPDYMYANEGQTDGVVVTFAPTVEGTENAVLVIESNDPAFDRLEIPLTGVGYVEPPPEVEEPETGTDDAANDDGPAGNPTIDAEVRGCGCSSTSNPVGAMGLLALVGLVGLRRRR